MSITKPVEPNLSKSKPRAPQAEAVDDPEALLGRFQKALLK